VTPNFHAGFVSIEDKGEYLLIGLVDDEVAVGDYLTLQRAHEFDEQDLRLGMDKVYIERNEQGYSCYGGIESFELSSRAVRVRFDAQGSERMGGTRQMEVSFAAGRYQDLRAALEQCFKGFSWFSVLQPNTSFERTHEE
jgi:hypothetical protein